MLCLYRFLSVYCMFAFVMPSTVMSLSQALSSSLSTSLSPSVTMPNYIHNRFASSRFSWYRLDDLCVDERQSFSHGSRFDVDISQHPTEGIACVSTLSSVQNATYDCGFPVEIYIFTFDRFSFFLVPAFSSFSTSYHRQAKRSLIGSSIFVVF